MKKFFFILFFLFTVNISFSEENIVYLDINYLLSESKVGKNLNLELNKINKINIEEFKKFENSIKEQEKNILNQKNLLNEDEYKKKINELKENFKSYQALQNEKNNNLKKLRNDNANKILNIINQILTEYSTKHSISLIIEKKNIVIGKSQLDVTKEILILLDNKITKIELSK